MSDTTNLNMRVTVELLHQLDEAAQRQGLSRTAYILSWLPEHHDSNTPNGSQQATENARQS